ncbi:MAG: hypothetical protein AAGG51_26435 [Cyanobacteria bacterium P01_G01_bin.54]
MTTPISTPPKRPYHAPQLQQYGTINTLTQAAAVDGATLDGAGLTAVPNKTE